MKDKNKYGQYFTIDTIAEFMVGLISHDKTATVLEPSCGKGVFLHKLEEAGFKNIDAYEIDKTIGNEFPYVKHESFVSSPIEPYHVVIGNPPYIRWKNLEKELKEELSYSLLWNKYFNSLCDYLFIFILKSIEQLYENGELIFICTEYWLNTTNSQTLRNYMMENGYLSEIYHFKEASLFEGVCASFIIFRFVKSKNTPAEMYLYRYNKTSTPSLNELKTKECFTRYSIPQFKRNGRWILATKEQQRLLSNFEEKCMVGGGDLFSSRQMRRIGDICDIGNGMVSGLDKAFNVSSISLTEEEEIQTIKVLKAKELSPYFNNSESKYFFIQEKVPEELFLKKYPNVAYHMNPYIDDLNKRYNYGKEINYWEFVFPRNLNLFSKKEKRILVPCKERISNKSAFRFVLAEHNYYPLQDVTGILKKSTCKESIEYITAHLNNERVFEWLSFNGIVKGYIVEFSEAPIASIPFREIDWNNSQEVDIHNSITELVNRYIETHNADCIKQINSHFNTLFK